ncbi:hapless 2-like [Ischnura elegans]|uniref:hapless 2-like n=1 Tax=Ischnura elegans TaxID=197161 RepID=UPI001ED88BDD|nr:hapless 2-like [Ischnura elegans]
MERDKKEEDEIMDAAGPVAGVGIGSGRAGDGANWGEHYDSLSRSAALPHPGGPHRSRGGMREGLDAEECGCRGEEGPPRPGEGGRRTVGRDDGCVGICGAVHGGPSAEMPSPPSPPSPPPPPLSSTMQLSALTPFDPSPADADKGRGSEEDAGETVNGAGGRGVREGERVVNEGRVTGEEKRGEGACTELNNLPSIDSRSES